MQFPGIDENGMVTNIKHEEKSGKILFDSDGDVAGVWVNSCDNGSISSSTYYSDPLNCTDGKDHPDYGIPVMGHEIDESTGKITIHGGPGKQIGKIIYALRGLADALETLMEEV